MERNEVSKIKTCPTLPTSTVILKLRLHIFTNPFKVRKQSKGRIVGLNALCRPFHRNADESADVKEVISKERS